MNDCKPGKLPDREAFQRMANDLEELCHVYDISLELISKSDNLEDLLDLMLDEYERRLSELPNDALDELTLDPDGESSAENPKLRGLVMFATQAAAIKARAEAGAQIRRKASELEDSNTRLATALEDAYKATRRLTGVMESIDAGILIIDSEGLIMELNQAACNLLDSPRPALLGTKASIRVGDIGPRSSGEVRIESAGRTTRTWLVTRTDMSAREGEEVILIKDVTERDREAEERHRSQTAGEVLNAVAVMAHRINNPLTSLLGRAQLLSVKKGMDPKILKSVKVMEESALRIADLIKELASIVKEKKGEGLDSVLKMPTSEAEMDGTQR